VGNQLNSTFIKVDVTNGSGDSLEGINVTIYLGESFGSVNLTTNESGSVKYKMPDAVGTYNVVVSINSSVYESDSVKQSIIVGKIPINLTVCQVGEYYDSAYLLISLKDLNGIDLIGVGLNVLINGTEMNCTTNGSGMVLYKMSENAGVYNIKVSLNSDYFESNPVEKTFNLKKYSVFIYSSSITAIYNINKYLTVYLKDMAGMPIVGVNVTVNINGAKTLTTDDNGLVNISTIDLTPDAYDVLISFDGNGHYNCCSNTTQIIVNKDSSKIFSSKLTTVYKTNKYLVVTLKDSQGRAIVGADVVVNLNGAKTLKTDKNGQVKVSTKNLVPKTYTAKITFNGNANYEKSIKSVEVSVKKATPKLVAKKKTFKAKVKTKKYVVTLKDNTGKAIKKANSP
jgi:hypothetical protein